jgi:acyl-coenzyme A synthetase/AMP-(fatty) acid ligase
MNLIDPIHQHAASMPDRPAIITSRGHLSWAAIDRLIWSIALDLHRRGLSAGDRVGITMVHPVRHLLTALALARIGVAHLAIPAFNSQTTRNELTASLSLKSLISDLDTVVAETPGAILLEKHSTIEVRAEEKAAIAAAEADLPWLILQSSGTTGKPKFAELTHASAIERHRRFQTLFNCTDTDIFWAASAPDFVVAKQRLTFNLLSGAAVCLPRRNVISPELLHFLNQHRITIACGTPSHLHQLIDLGEPMPYLRAFEARSAFISEKLRRTFRKVVTDNLYIVYGTNEGETLALADPALQSLVPDTVGMTSDGLTLEVVDEHGTQRPALVSGEIRVRGPGVITSYIDNPEASAKSFRNGWFYPGDLGFMTAEGALVLQGRKDDMMIFDGINIYPAEIEGVLAAHPSVREAAAFSLRHERFQDVPVAAVTLTSEASEKALIEHCRNLLGIKHPKRVFVLEEFPRNPMGKILRRELAQHVRQLQSAAQTP